MQRCVHRPRRPLKSRIRHTKCPNTPRVVKVPRQARSKYVVPKTGQRGRTDTKRDRNFRRNGFRS